MTLLKCVVGVLAIYVVFVVVFEAGYLGVTQPSFADNGIPMLQLTTTDANGEPNTRMLARFESDGELYVSAHHWTRGWYHNARRQPEVMVEIDDVAAPYLAVPATQAEFDRVAAQYPLPLPVRLLMGFPPPRDILKLRRIDGAGE